MAMTFPELFAALTLATLNPTPAATYDACATPRLGSGGPVLGTTCHTLSLNGVDRT